MNDAPEMMSDRDRTLTPTRGRRINFKNFNKMFVAQNVIPGTSTDVLNTRRNSILGLKRETSFTSQGVGRLWSASRERPVVPNLKTEISQVFESGMGSAAPGRRDVVGRSVPKHVTNGQKLLNPQRFKQTNASEYAS